MRRAGLNIILIFMVLSAGCDTLVEAPGNLLRPYAIRSYDDADVVVLTDATPGNGVVWLTFLSTDNVYHFKLVSNDGDELWTIKTDLKFERGSRREFVQKVIFEEDGLVTVFYNFGRIKYNLQGEEVSRQEDFVQMPFSIVNIRNVILGPGGEYLFMGTALVGGDRAFAVAFDQQGNELFQFIFAITSNGRHCYTGAKALDDGTYLLAGSYSSPVEALSNAYFVTMLDAKGEGLFTKVHTTTEFHGFPSISEYPGRDLITIGEGNYLYSIDGWGTNSAQRLVQFDQRGDEVAPQQSISFGEENRSYGTPPFIGSVIASHADGHVFGVMNTSEWVLPGVAGISTAGYIPPHFARFYQFSPGNNAWSASFYDRNYSNYLSVVARLSNGKIMMAGTILSLGADVKIIVTIL